MALERYEEGLTMRRIRLAILAFASGLAAVPASAQAQPLSDGIVGGVRPGMSYEEFDRTLKSHGYVATSTQATSGAQTDTMSVRSYGNAADKTILHVETRDTGASPIAFRIIAAYQLGGEVVSPDVGTLEARFGADATCPETELGAQNHYDAAWTKLDEGPCDINALEPLGPMTPEARTYFSLPRAWRHTISGARYQNGGKATLFVIVQDNLEAARAHNPDLSWEKSTSTLAVASTPTEVSNAPEAMQDQAARPQTPTQPEEVAKGSFALRDIHGVSLRMPRNQAIKTLIEQGFTRTTPEKPQAPSELKTAIDGGQYVLGRDYGSHDNFATGEHHRFERDNITISFKAIPPGENATVSYIMRDEKLKEPVFLEAALRQISARVKMRPMCTEAEFREMIFEYRLTEAWLPASDPELRNRCRERGPIEFSVRARQASGRDAQKNQTDFIRMFLNDYRRAVEVHEGLENASRESRARKAATQKGISDF